MPDTPDGIQARVANNERRLNGLDASIARIGERVGMLEAAAAVAAASATRIELKLEQLSGRPSWAVATLLTLETTAIAVLATLLATH